MGPSTLWHAWKARCQKVFQGKTTPPAETIMVIWVELVFTLQSQNDNIKGDTDAALVRRMSFHKVWFAGPFYRKKENIMIWDYKPPRSLFPPPIL